MTMRVPKSAGRDVRSRSMLTWSGADPADETLPDPEGDRGLQVGQAGGVRLHPPALVSGPGASVGGASSYAGFPSSTAM